LFRSMLRPTLLLAGALVLAGATPAPAAKTAPAKTTTAPSSLTMVPGREFAATSYVHSPLAADAPLDPDSAGYVQDVQRQISAYYGHANVNWNQYTPPVWIVDRNQATVRVRAWDRDNPSWSFPPLQDKWLDVPLPAGFRPSAGTDQEAIVYQPSTGRYWEFWRMAPTGATVTDSAHHRVAEWGARWGGRIDDLTTSPGYFTDPSSAKYGTAATGLAELGGLMTIEEQQRGVIDHAVHVALPETRRGVWSFPAQRTDGQIDPAANPYALPEGATLRLPPDLDLDAMAMDLYARMIAKAVQTYGMVVRDKAGAVTLYAENAAGRYVDDPYTKAGGILRCANGTYAWSCSTPTRLTGFPWDRLQVLKLQM
jgi:hypothetical protein